MIVSDKIENKNLLSWDYESPVKFSLPLGSKKFDLKLGKILPRIIDLCCNGTKA
jgi:hypothetical protein